MNTTTETLLHARRSETERGRAAVAQLEAARADALLAHSTDMTADNRGRLKQLDDQLKEARLNLESFEMRERQAKAAYEAEVEKEKRAALKDLLAEADTERLFASLQPFVARVVDLDRAVARAASDARQLCAKQREALERAQQLARELGDRDAFALEAVHLDDFRGAVGQAIARARAAEGRSKTRSELFLHPIAECPRHGEKLEATLELATTDSYQFASRILDASSKGKI